MTNDSGFVFEGETPFVDYGDGTSQADIYLPDLAPDQYDIEGELLYPDGTPVSWCSAGAKTVEVQPGVTLAVILELVCAPEEPGAINIVAEICTVATIGTPLFDPGKHLTVPDSTIVTFEPEGSSAVGYAINVHVKDEALAGTVAITPLGGDQFEVTCLEAGPADSEPPYMIELVADLEQCGVTYPAKQTFHIFCHPAPLSYGCFAPSQVIPAAPQSPVNIPRITTGDLDNDGDEDVVIAHGYRDVGVLLNNGDGTFGAEVVIPVPGSDGNLGATNIEVADMNSDGNLDLVVPLYGWHYVDPYTAIYYGDGSGTFSDHVIITSEAANPTDALAADFDGDGRLDLAISHNNGGWDVVILLQDASGGFVKTDDLEAGQNPQWLAGGDFDADGWPDLVAGVLYSGDFVYLNKGTGDGLFDGPTIYGSPDYHYVAVGDLNQDGYDDFIARGRTQAEVMVFMNAGDGSFPNSVTLSTSSPDGNVAIADLNDDGWPDLAVNSLEADKLDIFTNDRAGGFGAPVSIAVGDAPAGIAAADLTGDGRPDLVLGDGKVGDEDVWILANVPCASPCVPGGSFGPECWNEGLVVWYPFTEPFEATGTILDHSGNGHHAEVLGGVSQTSGVFGSGASFDGQPSTRAQAASNPVGGRTETTISLWFKTNCPGCNYKLASGAWWAGGNNASGWVVGTHAPEFWLDGLQPFVAPGQTNTDNGFQAGEWIHEVVTYDGERVREYTDGVLINDWLATGHPIGMGNALVVGAWPPYYAYVFNGELDDFRVYDRALGEAEIAAMYAAGLEAMSP